MKTSKSEVVRHEWKSKVLSVLVTDLTVPGQDSPVLLDAECVMPSRDWERSSKDKFPRV